MQHPTRVQLAVLGVVAAACGSKDPAQEPRKVDGPTAAPTSTVEQAAAPTSPAQCTLAPVPHRLPAPRRLVAIGDLHGDLSAARAALRTAGAIDENDRWIGADLVVVQTGDVLDRGDDEQAILDLLARLETEAHAAGGALVLLLGNHELMNAAGDFRYVTPGGLSDFADVAGLDTARWQAVPAAARSRFAAFAPGGPYAKQLAQHNVVAIVGDTVFSHAGVLGSWAAQVSGVNQSSRCWLDGQAEREVPPPALSSQESPVWTRAVGSPEADCSQLKSSLQALGVKRMVVGHTIQPQGINAACDGAVWRIDVGMSKAYGGPIEVLELSASGEAKVLKGSR